MLQYVLTAVTLYILSIHELPVWIRKKLDSIRAKFLWQGPDSTQITFDTVIKNLSRQSKWGIGDFGNG
jgi:hypothetical protein